MKIPDYNPQVSMKGLPNVQQQAFNQSSAAPAALNLIGESLIEYQKRVDTIAVKDGYLKAQEQMRTLFRDPETGLLNTKGANALGTTKKAQNELEKIKADAMAGMNPSQKAKFELAWREVANQQMQSIAVHESRQFSAYENNQDQALIENALADALDSFNIDDMRDSSVARAKSHVESMAKRNGWSPERTANYIRKIEDSVHKDVLNKYISAKNTDAAKAYLKKYDVPADIKAGIKDKLEFQDTVKKAQVEVDNLIAKHKLNEGAALQEARSSFEGEERDQIVRRLQARYADERRVQQQNEQAIYDNLTASILDKSQTREEAEEMANVTNRGLRQKLMKIVDAKYSDKKSEAFYVLASQNIMRSIDEGRYNTSDAVIQDAATLGLEKDQINAVVKYFNEGGIEGQVKFSQVNGYVKELTDGSKSMKDYPELLDRVKERLAPGEKVTDTKIFDIVKTMLMEVEIIKNWWPDPDMTLYEAIDKGYAPDAISVKLNTEQKNMIREVLILKGIKPTDAAIRKYYSVNYLGVTE